MAAVFSPDGSRILTGSYRAIRHWDAATGRPLGEAVAINAPRTGAVAFSPDCAIFVTGGEDGIPRLWDTATGQLIRELEVGFPLFGILGETAFSADGSQLAGGAGTLGIWDVETGKLISQKIRRSGASPVVFSPGWLARPYGRRRRRRGTDVGYRQWNGPGRGGPTPSPRTSHGL